MTTITGSDAAVAIGGILDQPPTLANVLRGGTRLTQRWRHGEFHASLPAMDTHVIMTYYGAAQNSSCHVDGKRGSGRTRPGSVTIIPEGQDGRWDVAGPIEVSHVYLSSQRLQEAARSLSSGISGVELIGRICFDDPVASRILEILSHEAASGDASSSLFADHALDLLCAQLIRGHSSQSAISTPPARKGLVDWQVRRVTDYMKDALDQEIRLDDLAGLLQMSRFHFCTAFRLATGQTPHEWLTALRIGQARHLLMTTELPVTSVGLAVGYQTPSSFAAAFRKVTGVAPSSLRRGR
jgi:AraC family transcriptional regulator